MPQETRPQPGPAGYNVVMIRPDLQNIPQVPFPQDFGIRAMQQGEDVLWTSIWRDAEPYFTIDDDTFHKQFGTGWAVIEQRCFIVTNEQGADVGTISAWHDPNFRGESYGQIHWVAVRPAFQGLGLGKAMLAFALQQLARWHTRCYLGTQTKRLPAINLYLNFGFVPDLSETGARAAWEAVREQLKHPVLDEILKE